MPENGDLQEGLLSPIQDQFPHSSSSGDKIVKRSPELEDIFVTLGKRVYAQLNLFIMCANTITAIFSISEAVSLIPEDDDLTLNRYQFCTYGDATSVTVQCPYETSPYFLTFLVLWSFFFMTVFIYKFHGTYEFWSNDLRFYLVNDMLNNTWFMFVLVVVGMFLTMISCVGGLAFVCLNGSTQSIGSILVFTGVNMYNLYNMSGGEFQALKGFSIHKDFPWPIMVDLSVSRDVPVSYAAYNRTSNEPVKISRRPVDGITAKHRDILDFVAECVLQKYLPGGDSSLLERLGDPIQLEEVVRALSFVRSPKT